MGEEVKSLPKPEKLEAVAELKERIQNARLVVMTKYVGINAGQATELRRRLRDQDVELKVYKNTLAQRVLDELGLADAGRYMDGPTAWAFSTDPVAPAKVFRDFAKDVPAVGMNGGILTGKLVGPAELERLADLPPREVLLGQVAGTLAAPMQNLAQVLNALPRNLANALDQVRRQKEEGGAAA